MSLFGRREDAPRERSREERERARLEREARRAARRGDPPPFESAPPRFEPEPPQPPVEAPRAAPQPPVETPALEEVDGPPRSARVRRVPRAPTPPVPLEDQPAAAPPLPPKPPAVPETTVHEPSPHPPPVVPEPPPVPEPPRAPDPVAAEPPRAPEPPRTPQPTADRPPPAPAPAPRRAPSPAAYEPPPASEVPAHDRFSDLASDPADWAQEPSSSESSFGEIPADPRAGDHGDDGRWRGEEVGPVPQEPEPVAEKPAPVSEEPEPVAEELPPVSEEPAPVAKKPKRVAEPVAADTASRSRLPEAPPLPTKRASRRIPRARRVGGVGPPPGRLREAQAFGDGAGSNGRGSDEPPVSPAPGRMSRRGMGSSRPLALAVVLVAILLVGWLLVSLFQPFAGEGGDRVSVRIPDGAGAGEIGSILAEEGVVDSGFFFRVRATLSGERSGLRSGKYDLREGMSYDAAITALSTPPQAAPPPPVIDVTLPEGLSRQEMAPTIRQAGVPGNYVKASVAQKGFRPERDFEAPAGTDSLEGFLFPATYEVPRQGNAEDLVSLQLKAFEDNIDQVDMAEAQRRNLTPYEVLTIASMVEREAQQPAERPLIAAVIHNRLNDGMRLGIDATIRYANDNWDRPLRQSELQADGPYNTRTRAGLPPTPIGNPGLDSIKAAAYPADKDFLFYVVKPGTCGEHAFSSTDAQFQQDVARYNQARERAGGRSPTNC